MCYGERPYWNWGNNEVYSLGKFPLYFSIVREMLVTIIIKIGHYDDFTVLNLNNGS